MTKVILKQDNGYINSIGQRKFGKKGEAVDVADTFLDFIKDKYDLQGSLKAEEKSQPEKPLTKMNKAELIDRLKLDGIEMSDEELEEATKAEIIALIEAN